MKHLIKVSLLVILTVTTIISFIGVFAEEAVTVDVTVTSMFNNQEVVIDMEDVQVGSEFVFDDALINQEQYFFSYWIIDGYINTEYELDNLFIFNSNVELIAVFHSLLMVTTVFTTEDGHVLDIQVIPHNSNVLDNNIELPSKQNYIISTPTWDKSLEEIKIDTIFILQYELDVSLANQLTVINGTGSGRYLINSPVTITADAPLEGEYFSHWEEDGEIISRASTDTFTMVINRTLEAIYTSSSPSDEPLIHLSDEFVLSIEEQTYLAHFYIPSDLTLVEFGVIKATEETFTLDTVGVEIETRSKINDESNEFLVTLLESENILVMVYLIVEDSLGNETVIYSEIKGMLITEEIVEYYTTSFEDTAKGSYAAGLVVTNGKTWMLNDALIGSLDSDQTDLSKSIRLRTGDVTSQFAIDELYQITFLYGRYLSDSASTFSLEISDDLTVWIPLDSNIYADTAFERYEFTLTDEIYSSLSLDKNNEYYIRIKSTSSERVNIDDIHIIQKKVVIDDPNGNLPLESDTLVITLPSNIDNIYSLGDTYVIPTCTAVDDIIGEVDCLIEGTVDTSNIGAYLITFYAHDGEGLIKTKTIEYIVFRDEALLEIDYIGYYDGIEGLYGQELLEALRIILNDSISRISYGEARYALDDTDEDPNNPSNILTVYTRDSVSEIWDLGATWNREHVWPNSRLGIPRVSNSSINIGSDLHNLRACVSSINSSRSNKVFGLTTTADTYFPGNYDKGDISRILFYMVVMYSELELVEQILPNNPDTNYTLEGADMSILQYLIMWHYQDTVDSFETARNEEIYEIQDNRNPFIDYEYLVELIWYNHINIPETD
jgi:endonuclease I